MIKESGERRGRRRWIGNPNKKGVREKKEKEEE